MSSRVSQLKNILINDYGSLFEEQTVALINPKSTGSRSGEKTIYLPESNLKGENSINLVCGVGSITIQETVDKNDTVIGYIYRFFSNEYICDTYRISEIASTSLEKDEQKIFSFHYDRTVDNIPHPPHVTVGHPTIRYISKEIKIQEFLDFIKDTFFSYGAGGKLITKKDPIWCNRA